MTAQTDIQSLIADIDHILHKPDFPLPWFKSGDLAAAHQVLRKVRSYLVSQQQKLGVESDNTSTTVTPSQTGVPTSVQEEVQQILQAVNQEMNHLRTDLTKPWQVELEALQQQRESLVREIQRLESTKQQLDYYTKQQTANVQIASEFSQGLINRLVESLTQKLSQILANWEAHLKQNPTSDDSINRLPSNQDEIVAVVQRQKVIEQLQQLQKQSDQLIQNIDVNQRLIFETLHRDLQGYQESLSQELEKMHSLGMQGEMFFAAFVNRLAQQLGRESSSLWSSSQQPPDVQVQLEDKDSFQLHPETLLHKNSLTMTEVVSDRSRSVAKGQSDLTQEPAMDWSTGELPQSWGIGLSEEKTPLRSRSVAYGQSHLADATPESQKTSRTNDSVDHSEVIATINALTDLCEQMGVNYLKG
ncbi:MULTISPECIES: hypothetical protein [Moorena]|uniref:hypothetical protein n=1 Tax=Moorena TaxID=1155738 RepID=UPI000302A2AF|nr:MULTISPECIES: hypothetical protein [Moorena]NEQ14652.1 hypothetical protein [Moorena sp. SIO3E2]NEP32544.1 hypothetical protein [Moorena sp. SIO3B2]NEP64124.1 hypothetical protein [Moorena sp. SIO3A5]NER89791.1 hypothetical protein [Moorena sp. SIO3A2]NES44611.1 hypothetical protein [Moorena sp. SIO2C4]